MTMNTELDELPTLTPKQTSFVTALLQGKTASDAYREAYNCDMMSHGAISVEASRLRRTPKVSLWLRHYQRTALEAGTVMLKEDLGRLIGFVRSPWSPNKCRQRFKLKPYGARLLASMRIGCGSRAVRVMRNWSRPRRSYSTDKQTTETISGLLLPLVRQRALSLSGGGDPA